MVLEAGFGMDERGSASFYEYLQWSTVDQLIKVLGGYGSRLACRHEVELPARGWPMVLRLEG
ncbi:hypothetical protein DFAR_1470046 [Desulfarculales bacterium]